MRRFDCPDGLSDGTLCVARTGIGAREGQRNVRVGSPAREPERRGGRLQAVASGVYECRLRNSNSTRKTKTMVALTGDFEKKQKMPSESVAHTYEVPFHIFRQSKRTLPVYAETERYTHSPMFSGQQCMWAFSGVSVRGGVPVRSFEARAAANRKRGGSSNG